MIKYEASFVFGVPTINKKEMTEDDFAALPVITDAPHFDNYVQAREHLLQITEKLLAYGLGIVEQQRKTLNLIFPMHEQKDA